MTLPLKLYAVAAAAAIAGAAAGVTVLQWVATPLLAPLLIWHLLSRGRRDLVTWGFGLAAAGGVAMLLPGQVALVVGVTLFAGTHVCLLLAFLSSGKPLPGPSAFWALSWVSANALLYERFGAMRVPLLFYSLALTAMAAAAAGVSRTLAAGGALFAVASVLVGVGAPDVLVTASHAAALALIGVGWTRAEVSPSVPVQSRRFGEAEPGLVTTPVVAPPARAL
ncbi:lysoplasmalogenase family protein [Actinoplanes sp. DH11]|uniref:lysoplasmalogenase family protein n=1 Tax=Actinoplanes sp. DH11 TaxID=2857011 RepID=UPI001E504ADE|nr:lysoplasmalogenase family protein [Actinoplanes sp. DH11]